MKAYLPILIFAALSLLLLWMRKGGGGTIGQRVRNSDHLAWRNAMRDKERELEELRKKEPKQIVK